MFQRSQNRFSSRPNQGGFRKGQRGNFQKHKKTSMSKNELFTAINNIKVVGKDQNVQVTETSIVHNSFREFTLSETLQRNIAEKQYAFPTPIQDQAIPAVLEGRDV